MPLYEYKCQAGHRFDAFLKLADYDKPQTCKCGAEATKLLSAPMFSVDFPAYQSPTTGKWITSRTERREDLKRSNCVEYEPSMVQEQERRIAREEAELDRKVEEHVEETLSLMPTRDRERVMSEVESLDIEISKN